MLQKRRSKTGEIESRRWQILLFYDDDTSMMISESNNHYFFPDRIVDSKIRSDPNHTPRD